jgi:hypothetical protein
MNASSSQILNSLLEQCSNNPVASKLLDGLDKTFSGPAEHDQLDDIIDIYQQALPVIEQQLWRDTINADSLQRYQKTFRELEHYYSLREKDTRHDFIIVIPVADRPKHLQQCIQSLYRLCETYRYGSKQTGDADTEHSKISILIADDSEHEHNIEQHKRLAEHYSQLGIRTEHFGAEQQIALLNNIEPKLRSQLKNILGEYIDIEDADAFSHKGASITRNITYLKLYHLTRNRPGTLIYFIDSDQEFCVNTQTDSGLRNVYALNYLHHLDEIFTHTDASILTGKVVGDPPVSPAVMASNFLDDVIAFLQQIRPEQAEQDCQFHSAPDENCSDAAYHDMAELFGFDHKHPSFQYHCHVEARHDHITCFTEFADKLNHFFYGEHPTRLSYFNYYSEQYASLSSTIPARTVYTGNYIFKPENLKYFIAFADLNLRMAGPVLGRLIRAELGQGFVSANLPMLHNRTVRGTDTAEFRSGVNSADGLIDLGAEFERQYFGDVMLFTIEQLVTENFTSAVPDLDIIEQALAATEQRLLQQYQQKHDAIKSKLTTLQTMLQDQHCWWHHTAGTDIAIEQFRLFIKNIEYNFGEHATGFHLITCAEHRQQRLAQLANAILAYADDHKTWQQLIQ